MAPHHHQTDTVNLSAAFVGVILFAFSIRQSTRLRRLFSKCSETTVGAGCVSESRFGMPVSLGLTAGAAVTNLPSTSLLRGFPFGRPDPPPAHLTSAYCRLRSKGDPFGGRCAPAAMRFAAGRMKCPAAPQVALSARIARAGLPAAS
jgi:hypothetical protein